MQNTTSLARRQSEANVYHVFVRGVGRMTLFENDNDRLRFLEILDRSLDSDIQLLAWCLMDNHVHLVVLAEMFPLSHFMRRVQISYASYFNGVHGRVGHLFQGRFGSEPIEDDNQLLACVRYVHMNPQAAGIAAFDDYKWSSFGEYVGDRRLVDPDLVLGILGGSRGFYELHNNETLCQKFMEESTDKGNFRSQRLTDSQVEQIFLKQCGANWRSRIMESPKAIRDEYLANAKKAGATVQQLSRLTGLGRGIVQRAKECVK